MAPASKKVFSNQIKKGRGRAKASIEMIAAMYDIAKEYEPITGRGVGYQLFNAKLISSMDQMPMVYRLLKLAREDGTIPWEWIVDETRTLEKAPSWDDPDDYMHTMVTDYRRDFWQQQPKQVEVWSEKGTIRGVLQPVLDEYGVGFRVMHGFGSATVINDVASRRRSKQLIVLYVGDFDPSGMSMSEHDIPKRIKEYGGKNIRIKRIALTRPDCDAIGRESAFNVKQKTKDPRAPWFRKTYGQLCWELDAMDPNALRSRVEREIKRHIEPVAWRRCETVFEAEKESMTGFLNTWKHWT